MSPESAEILAGIRGDAVKRGWESRKLGQVCDLIARGIAPKYSDSGVVVLNQRCIRDHRLNFEFARRHDASAKSVPADRLVRVGDVLVNSTGEGTLGRVAQVRQAPTESATVDTHVTIVRPEPRRFFLDFFGYMLVFIENEIASSGEGASGQTELARSTLSDRFTVSFPTSLQEQKRIVAILDEAFEGLDRAAANAKKNLANARELFDSHLNLLCGQQRDDWIEKQLGDVCDLFQGLAINKGTKHLLVDESSLPLLRIKDLRNGSQEQYVAESGYPKNARVYSKDLIYTRTGQIGLVFRGREGVLHNNCFKIVPNPSLVPSYLFWWLQNPHFRIKITSLAARMAQPDITHTIFKAQAICVPPLPVQMSIVEELEALNADTQRLEAIYEDRLSHLSELKQSILQKAFAGELTAAMDLAA